jgi:hypothetical protein
MKNHCVFPDQSKVEVHSILDRVGDQTCISYFHEEVPQILWVPNDFIVSDKGAVTQLVE